MIQAKMIQKVEDLVCSMNHNLPIQMINLEKNIQSNKRLLCELCFTNQSQVCSLNDFLEQIQRNQNQKKNKVKELIDINRKAIEKMGYLFDSLKSEVINYLDNFINNTKMWVENLVQTGQQYLAYDFYKEMEKEINGKRQTLFSCLPLIDEIEKINQQYEGKIIRKLKYFQSFKKSEQFEQELKNLQNTNQQILIEEQSEFNPIQQQLIGEEDQELLKCQQFRIQLINDSNKQLSNCSTIAFNQTGSIMVSNEKSAIKIWKFSEETLELLHSQDVHQGNINCLVYSKQLNSFISGSEDQTIICWKQSNNYEWKNSQPFEEHSDSVLCLILNKSENQLISGGYDKQLIFWEVDLNNNKLIYSDSYQKHENQVRQLNFNQSETLLASCAFGEIILWQKQANNKWEHQQVIKSSIYGLKLQFINDSKFLWASYGKSQDKIQVFSQQNGKFEEQFNSLIQLDQNIQFNDNSQFPIIYNEELKILIVRHKHKIYIINHQKQDIFTIICRHDCGINNMCGALTKNGEYLVLFDQIQQQFQIFKLLNK
ncbi:unnamed protein product [Paramecium octaurelia]|uniref:WD40-repeat-containing domain n=1 Tax=Paramecium octaurelia TaxID=43137 RepID=A0A8S1VNN3_PAROT|nr:unnamed protein product [Paramecium octaurelia]